MSQILRNKIAIILGSTGGLGQAITKKYIDHGAYVISVGRNLKILEELDDYAKTKNTSTTIVPLDIKDSKKLEHLAQEIKNRFGRIDILVSAHSILGDITPLEHYAEKIWLNVINTNLNTNWSIIKHLGPLLNLSEDAVALFLTCKMSALNKAYWGAYSVSKVALEELVKIYSEETKNTNVRVNLVDPGPVSTKLRHDAFNGKSPEHYRKPEEIADLFVTSVTRSNIISGDIIYHKEPVFKKWIT